MKKGDIDPQKIARPTPAELSKVHASPKLLDQLRLRITEELTALLESQARTRNFADYITGMITDMHKTARADVEKCLAFSHSPEQTAFLKETLCRCDSLNAAVHLLATERQRQWHKNGQFIKDAIVGFNQAVEDLKATTIEKELFERHGKVLENIILSHEHLAQWKRFVQEILADFHAFFPFNFFLIAFAEEAGLSFYLYHMGSYPEEIKKAARTLLPQKMLRQLALSEETPFAIEEFQVRAAGGLDALDSIELTTVAVPEQASKVAGLLGVAFASAHPQTPLEQSVIRSILAVMIMVVGSSRALNQTLAELEYYSMHDPLTGLYNRRHFNEILDYEISRSERHHHEFSVLLLDLDDFKDINDSYGHPIGDAALRLIAENLRAHTRKGDIATRIGGDEFAIILPETPLSSARQAAETLRKTIRRLPFENGQGGHFHVTLSIGVVSYPRDARNWADLMASVDVALYRAKDLGKDSVCELVTASEQVRLSRDTRAFAETLRQGLREGRFIAYFQPIIDCRSGDLFAYEALARLREENGQIMAAGQFIETTEKYGLGRELDRVIMQEALIAQGKQSWGARSPRLFINLSAQEIQSPGILSYAEKLCHQFKISPHDVVFEITERDAIGDMAPMRKFLADLRKKGFAFALDDFGSGYNSFHYLRELHFEYVKIDGAFVRNLLNSPIDYALVRNLCRLCQDLGIQTIGEGVESKEILRALKDIRIDYAQGYYVGRPVPMKSLR